MKEIVHNSTKIIVGIDIGITFLILVFCANMD